MTLTLANALCIPDLRERARALPRIAFESFDHGGRTNRARKAALIGVSSRISRAPLGARSNDSAFSSTRWRPRLPRELVERGGRGYLAGVQRHIAARLSHLPAVIFTHNTLH